MLQTVRSTAYVLLVVLIGSGPTLGQIVVNTLDGGAVNYGNGACSLREAVENANSNSEGTSGDCATGGSVPDVIEFSVAGSIVLTSAIALEDTLHIDGPGADVLAVSGGGTTRLFTVSADASIEIRDITLRDGQAAAFSQGGAIRIPNGPVHLIAENVLFEANAAIRGGALYMLSGVTASISNSTFVGNVATESSGSGGGGAISFGGDDLEVVNTTFSQNVVFLNYGGGAIQATEGALTLDNATFVYNTAPFGAAAIALFATASLDYKNSVIAGNLATGTEDQSYADCWLDNGNIASHGHNILGIDTGCVVDASDIETNAVNTVVDMLADNGGDVPTHALAFGSPGIDAGETAGGGTGAGGCVSIAGPTIQSDARGEERAQGASMGGSVCDIGAYEAQTAPTGVQANLTVFLEGPYQGLGLMDDAIDIPVKHPFSDPMFDGTLLDYDGPESVASTSDTDLPDAVDWVLVALVAKGQMVAVQPAFVFIDGSVLTGDLTRPKFSGVATSSYSVVVAHRNHIPIQSATALDFSSGAGAHNFTTSMANAYSGGGDPMKMMGAFQFGMFACDANGDGLVTAPDFNIWNASTSAGESGYVAGDCNLDGIVTAPDFNIWNANTTAGAASQVP